MNEITIDMSPCGSPSSAHKLLETNSEQKLICQSKEEAKNISNELTNDTCSNSQTEFRLQLLPTVNHSLVYFDEILTHLLNREEKLLPLKTDSILSNHKISSDLRAKMVDWIIEVIYKAECTAQTLFISVGVLDRFLANSGQSYKSSEMHLIGVISMLLASKFEDVGGMDINFMFEQVVHKKISQSEMVDFELKMLHEIKYIVCAPTELDFLEVFAENMSEYITGSIMSQAKYISTLNLHSAKLATQKPSLKAAATLLQALRNDPEMPFDEIKQKLAKLSHSSVLQIEELSKQIEEHRADFKKLYPKLKNALNYIPEEN